MTYYEIVFGSGYAYAYRYVIEVEYPTTDYGALTDILIDYLHDKGNILLDMNNEWDIGADDVIFNRHFPGYTFNTDEYIQGGNYGDILVHYGTFYINKISKNDIKDAEIISAE